MALITFTSRTSAEVTMLPDLAKAVLEIIGKSMGERGVITVAEMSVAIERLDAAMRLGADHDGALARAAAGASPHDAFAAAVGTTRSIDHQRAWPIREMLRESRDGNADVLWGV